MQITTIQATETVARPREALSASENHKILGGVKTRPQLTQMVLED